MRGFSLRRLFLGVRGLIAQFQCRLFLLVQALIFGDIASFLVWAGFFLVLLVPITAGYGISVGLNLVMASPSRPRETSGNRFLDELLFLFGYPPGSEGALLRGTLHLRYCTSRFAHKVPTWSLPVSGGVALLVSSGHGGGM